LLVHWALTVIRAQRAAKIVSRAELRMIQACLRVLTVTLDHIIT
jgi:hypothetical protein